jgi:hypothetical protein
VHCIRNLSREIHYDGDCHNICLVPGFGCFPLLPSSGATNFKVMTADACGTASIEKAYTFALPCGHEGLPEIDLKMFRTTSKITLWGKSREERFFRMMACNGFTRGPHRNRGVAFCSSISVLTLDDVYALVGSIIANIRNYFLVFVHDSTPLGYPKIRPLPPSIPSTNRSSTYETIKKTKWNYPKFVFGRTR